MLKSSENKKEVQAAVDLIKKELAKEQKLKTAAPSVKVYKVN